jgi:KDO2-lipid IV(A) lauroyltransferase
MSKAFQHKIEYFFVKLLLAILNPLPLRLALKFGDLIGFLAFSVLRIRREITMVNLKNSFGDKYTAKEYRRIGLRSYQNFAQSMIEFGMYPKLAKMGLAEIVDVEGADICEEHLKTGKGAVIVSGHFGNLEMVGTALTIYPWPIDFLVGKQHNRLVNDLMNHNRSLFGVGIIEIGLTAREVFAALKKGRWVVMLSDQDARSSGVIINFLGRPASTPKGAAAFALKTGCPIIVAMLVRGRRGRHKLYIEGPLSIKPGGDKDEDIKNLTQNYSDVIAKYIEQYPDQWFWAHRRWKTTCPEDYGLKKTG